MAHSSRRNPSTVGTDPGEDGVVDRIEVRTIQKSELGSFVRTLETAFGQPMRASDIPNLERKLPLDRMIGAFDDEDQVGSAGIYPFNVTIPGGEIPAAGVTMIGVLPTHRRQGILRRMMRMQMEDARGRGESVALLWASEDTIYQRFGYGPSANHGSIDIEKESAKFLYDDGIQGRTRLVGPDERVKVLPSIYDRVRVTRPGMYERSRAWWEAHTLRDPEEGRKGKSPLFTAVLEIEGKPEAYANYRVRAKWDDSAVPKGTVEVDEAMGTSPVATREIWRFLFGIDLCDRVNAWYLPTDFPLLLMIQETRRLRFSVNELLWLRLVDLPAALEARTYAAEGSIVFEIEDDFCEWNQGRWRLNATDRRVRRTEEPAELVMKTNVLAGTYLGGHSFSQLARAGRIEERKPGSLAKADAMFRTEIAPWCPENF